MKKEKVVMKTNISGLGKPTRGKVRDVYDLDDELLIVTTDRLSAYDVVLPTGIPYKGKVLNQLSLFWFAMTQTIIENHVKFIRTQRFMDSLKPSSNLSGRSMIVSKADPFPFECVVRGYLSGSGWNDYKKKGSSVYGIRIGKGFQESQKLPKPIFTPTTKEENGHDKPISFQEMRDLVGRRTADKLRKLSLSIYEKGAAWAKEQGIIIADTKFEFGLFHGDIILIDEVLTPDSSRFWSINNYQVGKSQDSFDKQIVRDYLSTLDWDKAYPGPKLPAIIASKAAKRYREIFRIITGLNIE